MAHEQSMVNLTFPANADLSSHQYKFVVINSSGKVALAGAGDAHGVLQNNPNAADKAAVVCVAGRTKVQGNGTVNPGVRITCDSGGLAVAVGSGEIELGWVTDALSAGKIGSIYLQRGASVA